MKKTAAVVGLALLVPLATCRDSVAPLAPAGIAAVSPNSSSLVAGSWAPIASMANGRYLSPLVSGGNGKFYVFGGQTFFGATAESEAYTPSTNSWAAIPPHPLGAIIGHGAVFLGGKIYLVGGFINGTAQRNLTKFDPTTNAYSSGPFMSVNRYGASVAVSAGRILAAGGYDGSGFRASAELYSPTTNSWSATGSMPAARYLGATATGADGRVFVFGGLSASGVAQSSVYAYEAATGIWSVVGNLPAPRYGATATLLPDGRIVVFGGVDDVNTTLSTAFVYDPATDSWDNLPNAHTERAFPGAALAADGRLLVVGGNQAVPVESGEAFALQVPVTTTTALQAFPNSTVVGQPVTLSVVVGASNNTTPAAGETIAIVEDFGTNSVTIATAPLTATGTASVALNNLSVGTHQLKAVYAGNSALPASTSPLITQIVAKGSSFTDVVFGPFTYGSPNQFGIRITPSGNASGVPTGSVNIVVDGSPLATVLLTNGQTVSPVLTGLAGGNHTVEVSYPGDANFLPSSRSFVQVVNQATANVAVTSSANPVSYGAPLELSASVTSLFGTPTGTVSFSNGSLPLGIAPIVGGIARLSAHLPTTGTYVINATYSGDSNFGEATLPYQQLVVPATTSTRINVAGASLFNQTQPIIVTVDVVSAPEGPASGDVQVLIDGSPYITGRLENGRFIGPDLSQLEVGQHLITANYPGDANYASSSAQASQTVSLGFVSVALTAAPTSLTAGESVHLSATLSSPGFRNPGTPTGTVTFFRDGAAIGTRPIAGSVIGLDFAVGLGPQNFTAQYDGDSHYAGSMSNVAAVTAVTPPLQTITVDIQPGMSPNVINRTSTGTFDVLMYAPNAGFARSIASVNIGGRGAASIRTADVNGDGYQDVIATFLISTFPWRGDGPTRLCIGGVSDPYTQPFIGCDDVTVISNIPPVANAGPDQTVVGSASGASVTLDGSASTDADDGVGGYLWSEGKTVLSSGPSPTQTVTLGVGTHVITLFVKDHNGGSATDEVIVTVLSPAGGTQQLDNTVDALLSSGAINAATASQFSTSLDAAVASIASGNTNAAGNQLGAFMNKVQAALNSGKISASDGAALISFAQKIKNSL